LLGEQFRLFTLRLLTLRLSIGEVFCVLSLLFSLII
jgi:hypothetical protein